MINTIQDNYWILCQQQKNMEADQTSTPNTAFKYDVSNQHTALDCVTLQAG